MSYPDYAMSQGGDEDPDFGYLEFEAGTQDSQYEYTDFGPTQQTQHHNGTQDDLNFMNLSLSGGPHSQSDLGGNDDLYQQHQHQKHNHHTSGNGDQRNFEEADEHDLNDQPLALTELPHYACKYVSHLRDW